MRPGGAFRGMLGAAWILAFLGLTTCASGPEFAQGEVTATPAQVADNAQSYQGKSVLWGGLIIGSSNLDEATRLELLAYPLESNQRPDLDAKPQGRFLAMEEGYLETMDYAPGKLVTVRGVVRGTQQGQVGNALYTYPVVDMERIHLWPPATQVDTRPRVHFGVGVIFSN